MLSSITCRNFRALADVSIPLEPLTALVGPNGSGKSSVIDAIDMVLGSRWPSMAAVNVPYDFHNFDTGRDLTIEVQFDPPLTHADALSKEHQVPSLRFACLPYKKSGRWGDVGDLHESFEPLDAKGDVPVVATSRPAKNSAPQFRPLAVSGALREQAHVIVIGNRRDVASHLPSRRGSVLARLLAKARKEFETDGTGAKATFKAQYDQAMDALRTPRVREIESLVGTTAKRMLGFLGTSAVHELDVHFGFADPANPFGSLRLVCSDGGFEMPADLMGLGIQSALVVGVFDALRQIGGDVGTVAIEEPEMYLHPQAQRYFYSLLKELADAKQCQIIYTTHSPVFADMRRFEGVRLLRRSSSRTTRVDYVHAVADRAYLSAQLDRHKLQQYFDPATSEVLFADRAMLVEGYGDQLATAHAASEAKLDVDAEDISIVSCGGKERVPFYARACRALSIPFVVMHDEDIYSPASGEELAAWQIEENKRAPGANAAIVEAVGDERLIHLARPTLEAELGVSRDAKDKPLRVLEAMQRLTPEQYPAAIQDALAGLDALSAERVEVVGSTQSAAGHA